MINYQSATQNQLRVTKNQEQSIQHTEIQYNSNLQEQDHENQEKVDDDIVNQEQNQDQNQEVIDAVEGSFSDRQYLQATAEEIIHLKKRRKAKNNKAELCLLKICLFLFVFIILIGIFAFFAFYEEQKIREAQKNKNINMFALDGQISTVFIVENQQDRAFKSISSYLQSIYDYSKNNKGKLKFNDMLIGFDYNMSQKSRKQIQVSKNKINKLMGSSIKIRWIYNDILNIQFVDKLINEVQTEYFFFSTTGYVYHFQNQQSNKNSIRFLELSLSILQTFPQTAQLILNQNQGTYFPNNNIEVAFSFSPALHRTKDFHYLNKGFQDLVGRYFTMGQSQDRISEYYLSKNLYAMKVDKNFGITKIDNRKQIKIQNFQSTNPKFPQISQFPSQSQLKSVQGKYGVPKNIFENIKQQEIKKLHFKQIQTEISVLQKLELNEQNYFINRLHNARHFYTFSEYLLHNRAFNVLTVNCNQNCKQRFQAQYLASNHINKMKLKTKHISHLSELRSDQNQVIPTVPTFDWISFQDLELFFSSALQTKFLIQNYTNYGISVITDISSIHPDVLLNILRHMENKDFYYDQTKSLCLARVINRKVMIFIKGKLHIRQAQQSKNGKKNPKKNLVSIQTVFKMNENIPFIREWLIYHIEIGIDKFYLYDNSNSSYSQADFRATSDTNRFGMSLQCINYTGDQVQIQWQNLWAQFYEHIIYIIWEPKDSNNKVYYGQVEAQHDYIKNYKDVVKYTLFIDIDEMLFSPEDKNLEQFLQRYESNRISSIKFLQRHFVSRYCQPNKRMSQIYHFFQSQNSKLYNMKIIAETNSFLPFQKISEGKSTRGRQIVVPESQFRINHYSLQRNQFIMMREKGILLGSTFQTDNSILRYQSVLDARCRGLCSDIFAIKCPQDKLFANCLDVKENYPWQVKERVIDQNYKPIPPFQPIQPIQPIPRQPENTQRRPPSPPPAPYSPSKLVSGYLAQIQGALRQPRQFFQLSILKQIKQLPICAIVVPSQNYNSDVLIQSIKAQNYSNYQIIEVPLQKQVNSTSNSSEQTQNYYYFINRIKNECKLNPLVIFVRSPLLGSAFDYLNKNHQKYVAYVSYSKSQKSVEIHSFFFRIYELLDKNDFNGRNKPLLKQKAIEIQALGFLQISRQFVIEVQRDKIINPKDDAYFTIYRNSNNKFQRPEYSAIYRLSQDFPGNVIAYNQGTIAKSRIIPGSRLTVDHMYRAVERQEEWYLPENHTIEEIQFRQLDSQYNISKYTDISRQVRFCVTILSHNNVQNDRYIKILKSIIQQKYENYHIVFIDDNSTDSNMNSTIQYLNSVKFPKNRVKYVQNLERRFATYNIINAGFNFCDENDVQMLMDGDDQFIGKYAFQVMNSAYQLEQKENKQVWVAYSNYKSNFFTFGRSKGMNSDFEHMVGNRRSYISIFGPIRTWRVQVIYNIPILHHKLQNGQWLDTVYDDALCHPLFEISTAKRVRYMPEVLSEYNMRYGDNDDSTSQKIKHRSDAYRYIISLTPLTPLATLEGSVKDLEVMKELSADKDIKYTTIDL